MRSTESRTQLRVIRASGATALALGALVLAMSSAATGSTGPATSHSPSTESTRISSAPTGLPLYEFSQTGTTLLPWVATSLSSLTHGATMSAGPRTVQSSQGDVIAFSTATHDVAFLTTSPTASPTYLDLTAQIGLPSAADAPVPFYDSLGRLNLAYVSTAGHVIVTTNDALAAGVGFGRGSQFLHHGWLVHDLSTQSVSTTWPAGVTASGQLDAMSAGNSDDIVLRTPTNQLVQLTLSVLRPFALSAVTIIAPSVRGNPSYVGKLADNVVNVASVTSAGHLVLYRDLANTWVPRDLTNLLKNQPTTPYVAGTTSGSSIVLASCALSNGNVWLDTGTLVGNTLTWTTQNLTSLTAANASPGPALAGQLSVTVTATSTSVAGRAADWGNLFDYSNVGTKHTWVATDVSTAGGVNGTTVGQQVAAVNPSNTVNFFAGGISSPAPAGVGIYDIPYSDLPHVISDGWPILAITGGLGTTTSPWTQTRSSAQVASSPDFVIGKTIQNSAKRTGWLSFWTISGALASEAAAPATYQAHAFAAAAAIATQIDQYTQHGLHQKPDWVILDPEGYPDLHSQLDGIDISSIVGNGSRVTITTASSTSLVTGNTVAIQYTGVGGLNVANVPITVTSSHSFNFANTVKIKLNGIGRVFSKSYQQAIWSSLLTGWKNGLASVDSSLNPGVYVDESEYLSEGLINQTMPVFMAVAWYNGPPVPIAHSSNVLGYIEFGNLCQSGLVQQQLTMFAQPAWAGRYNTVQFTPPGYCLPSTP